MNKLTNIILAAATLGSTACADIQPNELVKLRQRNGTVQYFSGPRWEWVGFGTESEHWDGIQFIDFPLNRSAGEQQIAYKTADDNYLIMDINMSFRRDTTKASRDKWFLNASGSETQFPASVDAVLRETVEKYTSKEILNPTVAAEKGKLPVFEQMVVDLVDADLHGKFGTDPTSYGIWPGAIMTLGDIRRADLDRQANGIRRGAQLEAQTWSTKAKFRQAEVDSQYTAFLRSLNPAVADYLRTVEMTGVITTLGKNPSQKVDIILNVGGTQR